jgi:hypothetical protein
VGGASAQFPDLHHAFFVGDILIKRDCRSLQGLAPNVSIVNMYGTTEVRTPTWYLVSCFSRLIRNRLNVPSVTMKSQATRARKASWTP